MLLQFSVKNHRSIKEMATLTTKATSDVTMREFLLSPNGKKFLVPVVAIYGANAAGKTNLLHAMQLMQQMIYGEYAQPLKAELLPQEPFAFGCGNALPTSLEIIYYSNGIKYAYGFSFTKQRIETEYLYHWPNGREALVFSRENGVYIFRENIAEQTILASRTPENRLYLVCSNEWNCTQTEKAYLWFTNNLITPINPDKTIAFLLEGQKNKQAILREMLLADLGICDIQVKDGQIFAIHNIEHQTYSLALSQESMGTQRFFANIGSWMEAISKGSVLILDEIETSMHPLLTRHLIEMIRDSGNTAQLIFTTHDTGLLDQSLLRRDQIWFAERHEKTMETEIYALTEFSPRKSENIENGYLQGRYGAIPFVGGGVRWEE